MMTMYDLMIERRIREAKRWKRIANLSLALVIGAWVGAAWGVA